MAHANAECKGDIIEAHTISKKHIKNIAESGHVYIPEPSHYHPNGLYEFKSKGINEVTKMTGFCKHHDDFLFSSFEKKIFNGSYRQIYDITFRSLCREFYQKRCLLKFYERISSGDLSSLDKKGFTSSDKFIDFRKHTQKEFNDHKFLYNRMKRLKTYGLQFILIKTPKLPLQTTGVLFPLLSANGTYIQKIDKKQLGFIYNVIAEQNHSYIVIATVKYLKVYREFFNSLLPVNSEKWLINYLLSYFFWNNDNFTINPSWLETLSPDFKHALNMLLNKNTSNYGYASYESKLLPFDTVIDLREIIIKKMVN